MPVVIAYQPVGAIGEAANNVYRARRLDQEQGGATPQVTRSYGGTVEASPNTYRPNAPTPHASFFSNATGEVMTANGQGQIISSMPPNGGGQNYEIPTEQMGIDAATGQEMPMPGPSSSVRANAGQKLQLDNLKASGAKGDAFQEGMRKILGLPEPLVDYTVPETSSDETPGGTKLRLTAAQAAARMQADRAAEQRQAQFDARQKIAQAGLDARYAAIDAQSAASAQRLDQSERQLQQSQANAETKTKAAAAGAALKAQLENDNTEIAHAKAILQAQQKTLEAHLAAQPYKKSNDPVVAEFKSAIAQAQQALDAAYEAKKKTLSNHAALAAQADAAVSTAPSTAPATQPTAPAAGAMADGQGGSGDGGGGRTVNVGGQTYQIPANAPKVMVGGQPFVKLGDGAVVSPEGFVYLLDEAGKLVKRIK